jgi:hypothetical protein
MKAIKIALLLFVFGISGILATHEAFSKNPPGVQPNYMKELNTIVRKTVKSPDFTLTKEEHETVSVTFSLTDEGKIKVEGVDAPTERLQNHVKNQLEGVLCEDVIHEYGIKYKVTIRFRNS